MENPALTGPRLKFNRAVENLNAIKRDIDAYVEEDPHQITVAFEPDADCYVARLNSIRQPDPMLGVRVGEYVHNLRSALDYIAWQLARLRNSEEDCMKRRGEIAFPVCLSRERFDRRKILNLLDAPARDFLRRHQPFNMKDEPRNHWLAALDRLWNRDKHRLVHAVSTLSYLGEATFAPGVLSPTDDSPVAVESLLDRYGETGVAEGAEIAYIRFEVSNPERQTVSIKKQPRAEVFFEADAERFKFTALDSLCRRLMFVRAEFSLLIEGIDYEPAS
ncbi:MAG: hypothetical protein R2725_11760 [Solirubrobacterales bacterium]